MQAMQQSPAASIGAYRLERQLGEGGMGTVWAATHAETGASVALKLVKSTEAKPEQRRRMLREARVAAAINHPNVVRVLDVFEADDGSPVIVMEHLHGETLREKLDRELQLNLEEAITLLLPVISAVGTAHSLGIIHRDLKPENIFFARAPGALEPRVLDFGTVKLTATGDLAASIQLTAPGSLIGTPLYMAPEQITAEPLDHRADIWSLGVVLYESLSGGRPVDGAGYEQLVVRLLMSAIVPLRAVAPDLPSEVTDLVDRMLSRDPNGRPWDLRSVYTVLEPFARVPSLRFGTAQPDAR
jgi:eukaryotic-like serine/threonine-protein kinase